MSLVSQHLVANSGRHCALTTLFKACPSLADVATALLAEQWQSRRVSPHPCSNLYLLSSDPAACQDFIRPLWMVLVERYCHGADLALNTARDSVVESANDATGIDLDLPALQGLVNACGPILLDRYRQALVDFWNVPEHNGQTIWQRYASYLRQQLLTSLGQVPPGVFTGQRLNQLTQLATPAAAPRPQQDGSGQLHVSLLRVALAEESRLNPLCSALVMTCAEAPALLYTPDGRLLAFSDVTALQQGLARDARPLHQSLHPLEGDAFECMASAILDQQLVAIDAIATRHLVQEQATDLSLELAHLTSMLDLCPQAEQQGTLQLAQQLPEWLRSASLAERNRYARQLLHVAQGYSQAAGEFWLDGIDDAEYFTYRKLGERLERDHPGHVFEPWNIRIINHQTTAVALPTGAFSGTVKAVPYSLAQLAIGNLGLLRPGRVEIQDHSGQPLPDGFDERYLRTLVSELDIGSAYPEMLRKALLEDAPQKARRQRLLAEQLRAQLPATAMELHLHGQQLSLAACDAIGAVFAPGPTLASAWLMRPLGLLREAQAETDIALNAWLIEREDATAGPPCVLYRPLHATPLLEFASRAALLQALSQAGPLQEDMLQRLPAAARPVYADGGFIRPNLPGLMEMTLLGVPYEPPQPPSLAHTPRVTHLGEAVYLGCVEETIAHFQDHSTTSQEARWQQWQTLGWLLLNLALPLVGGTLAKAVWLVQIGIALKDYLQSDQQKDPLAQRLALVNLLVNVSLAVFAHTLPRVEPVAAADVQRPTEPSEPPLPSHQRLDFSWAAAPTRLDAAQRRALALLRSDRDVTQLGEQIATGPLAGLWQNPEGLWLELDQAVYRVACEEGSMLPRIVGAPPASAPGPWLLQDASGQWQLDLRLRLRGGMPGGSRLREQLHRNNQERERLIPAVHQRTAELLDAFQRLQTAERLLEIDSREPVALSCLRAAQHIDRFWEVFLRDLRRLNELLPGHTSNPSMAQWEFQYFYTKTVRHTALSKLLMGRFETWAEDIPEAGEARAERLRLLEVSLPYADEMISTAESLPASFRALEKLASPRYPDAQQRLQQAQARMRLPVGQVILATHVTRLEINWRRFMLHSTPSARIDYLLARCWKNLHLALGQRMRLYSMPTASEELSARLLQDMDNHFSVALRQLDNLTSEVADTPATLQVLKEMTQDVRFAAEQVKQDLQDYPPLTSVEQLRQQTPGLIETDHGLLLGQPRADDADVVDILDSQQRPLRTFRKHDDEWLEVKPTVPTPTPQALPLPTLLGRAKDELQKAKAMIRHLHGKAAENYLPQEFEELLDIHRETLSKLAASIEAHLPKAPSPTPDSLDSARQQVQAIHSLLKTLKDESTTLRTQATLRQKPSQQGLEYLVAQQQVQIHRVGRRRTLSALKGRQPDYLDEYEVRHDGQPLWYAHFHYASQQALPETYLAGHLKTPAQRLLRGRVTDPLTQQSAFVYRAPLSHGAARRYFFGQQPD